MTRFGIFSRQQSLHSNQQEYVEQTLTIPLPTNTADPEKSILTTLFYAKMNAERSRAFASSRQHPLEITQALLDEWLRFAGDHYRLALRQQGVAHQFNMDIASVILDLINSNIPEAQRTYANSDPNVRVDPDSGNLRFYQ